MRVLLRNCDRSRFTLYIEDGRITNTKYAKMDDYVLDCRGLPIKTLSCSLLSLNPAQGNLYDSWRKIMRQPMPPLQYFDALILGGVGATGAVEVVKHPVTVKRVKVLLDPMAEPETVEKYKGGIVARALAPEFSYGYKKERGKWPIEDIASLLDDIVLLNPFWATTWELKMIKETSFTPTYVYSRGGTSPIPLEIKKTMFSVGPSLYLGMSPYKEKEIAEFVASSHYWRPIRFYHEDERCWKFLSLTPPRLEEGYEARIWVGRDVPEIYINESYVLSYDDVLRIYYEVEEWVRKST